MRWADALNASSRKTAVRRLDRGDLGRQEPNVVVEDPGKNGAKWKAFHAPDSYGWSRVKLARADDYEDWMPLGPGAQAHAV